MSNRGASPTEYLARLQAQRRPINALHTVALVATALCVLGVDPLRPSFALSCNTECGVFPLLVSLVAAWPILVSWLLARSDAGRPDSFTLYVVLFASLSAAMCVIYLYVPWQGLHFIAKVLISMGHFAVLAALLPLTANLPMRSPKS
jgi:hypothetical protein